MAKSSFYTDGGTSATNISSITSLNNEATASKTAAKASEDAAAASATAAANSATNAANSAASISDPTASEIRALVESASDSNVFTDADHTKLNAIEANATADQTDAEIRAAVEAASDSNVFTDADHSKLNAIEASADVTDATNVAAAGALMDSEVTNLAEVKAFDSGDYATAAQGTLATNALPKSGGAMTGAITTNSTFDGRDVATDGTKLDGIEANATADQTAAEIRTLIESASDSNVFTDADHTKLNGIEASATADQTASEINALGITATGLSGTPNVTVGTVSSGNITTSGYIRGPASFTIDPSTHGDNTGTLVVAGNLQVDGTTTTINSTTVAIDDLNFSIATDAADSAAANGAGITIGGAGATLNYTHATASWDMNKPLNVTGDLTVNGNIKNSSGTMNTEVVGTYTIDVGGDIILDSDAANWRFKDAGTSILEIGSISSGTSFYNAVSDASMHFRGNDGGSAIQAMTIDYANGGRLGIGTTSPDRLLSLKHASQAEIGFKTGSVSNGALIYYNDSEDQLLLRAQESSDSITFQTGGTTERMRIDSSGNVGIGTSSPSRELHVQKASSGATSTSGSVLVVEDDDNTELSILGGSSSVLAINFGHSGDNDEGKITFNTTAGSEELELVSSKNIKVTASGGTTNINSTTNAPLIVKSTSSAGGYTEYQLGASGANIGYIGSGEELAGGSAANLTLRAQNQLVFASGGGTDRGRWDSSGRFLIGTTSALGDGLSLMPRYSESGTTSQIRWNRANTAGTGEVAVFQNNSSSVGSISHNNSSTSYNTSSDYRLKENVTYSWDATTRLKQLKPARFNWIVDDTNTLVDGFLAHEVSSIVPEAINGSKDAVDDDGNAIYQQIDQSKIVPLLVKTIQELEARITALEA